jgi:hypothetical protein
VGWSASDSSLFLIWSAKKCSLRGREGAPRLIIDWAILSLAKESSSSLSARREGSSMSPTLVLGARDPCSRASIWSGVVGGRHIASAVPLMRFQQHHVGEPVEPELGRRSST